MQLADHAVFASFHAAGNETLVATLRGLAAGESSGGCWLWGAVSTGKTHLLQAVCDLAGDQSVYLPLDMLAEAGPDVLDGLARRAIVCIDDVDAIAGDRAWEVALFNLCNDLQEAGHQLVVSAAAAPRESGFSLPDLESRLSRLPVFQLRALDEAERAAALQLRAGHRGIELPDETASFLLRRVPRD
ncbi:MAG: DnaA/Hda family protein, partial [Planctomycetes bacterium]|nr:DnaA/Hda family protein [Planctomycetota bacterium]